MFGLGGIEARIGSMTGGCIPTGVLIRGDLRSADVHNEFEVIPPFD
jgi:hypothetical protein